MMTVEHDPFGEPRLKAEAFVLSQEEAEELYRYTRNDYVNPNNYPALHRLIGRLTMRFAPRA
jgi:hypothetical protein